MPLRRYGSLGPEHDCLSPMSVLPADPRFACGNQLVCPDCGSDATHRPVCAVCGHSLLVDEGLPTRADWERSKFVAPDGQTRAIVERIAAVVRFTAGLVDVPVEQRGLDRPAAVAMIERTIRRTVEQSIPGPYRPAAFAVEVRSGPSVFRVPDEGPLRATASVALGEGKTVEQDFRAELSTGSARASISRCGPPRLTAPRTEPLGVSTIASEPPPMYGSGRAPTVTRTSSRRSHSAAFPVDG